MPEEMPKQLETVLIAEDHPLVQLSLQQLVASVNPQAEILTTSLVIKTIALVKERVIDLLLLDVMLEDGISITNIDLIKRLQPGIKILVLSTFSEEAYGKRALHLGADGYIDKKSSVDDMRNAIERVIAGQKYLSNDMMYKLAFNGADARMLASPFEVLTNREFEIMLQMLDGKTVQQIANEVNLQRTTVSTHKMKIFEKLKVSNMLDLQRMAVKFNLRKID